MFGLERVFEKKITKDDVAVLLKKEPAALEAFEKAYKQHLINQESMDNLFSINAKEAAAFQKESKPNAQGLEPMISRIVDELLTKTTIWEYDGENCFQTEFSNAIDSPVSMDEIAKTPEEIRPQLTGQFMQTEISEPSYISLLQMYQRFKKSKKAREKKKFYHSFRQGLDILDLDSITYQIIGMNPNSIGYWLPPLIEPVQKAGFFKIPKTQIMKVPLPVLQLTRLDYPKLTPTTLEIVDRFCEKAFHLDLHQDYFIKTGTYSSKFDFRNAHVTGEKEVKELGQYLLFIHFQALCMAHFDLSGNNQPAVYGVSTTNEWCVREFIPDQEGLPTIYNGLPLHTEYRVFVDFDTNKVLEIHPYWDAGVMEKRFNSFQDADTPQMLHDAVIFRTARDDLLDKYNLNKEMICQQVERFLPQVALTGQWSLDVMQNGKEFWIIDLAQAENSAFYDCIPKELRHPAEEKWLPEHISLD